MSGRENGRPGGGAFSLPCLSDFSGLPNKCLSGLWFVLEACPSYESYDAAQLPILRRPVLVPFPGLPNYLTQLAPKAFLERSKVVRVVTLKLPLLPGLNLVGKRSLTCRRGRL
jgi:hypothetical protein